ncbi:MAG: cache domain-containing protein, partial [Nitrospirota bacterium]
MRRGLQWKVILTIVGVGILPLATGLLWAGLYGRSALVNASGEKFTELAKLLSSHIDFIIDREIHEAQSLALSEELRAAVIRSNETPAKAPGAVPASVAASRYLSAYQTLKQEEYDWIIATDRHGRAVATTRPLPQSSFSHETWWRAAYREGRGAVYIRDLLERDADHPVRIELALPILDQERSEAIGVIKFLLNDLELDQILGEVKAGATGHAMLVGADGRVLLCTLHPPASHQPIAFLSTHAAGWAKGENGHGGGSTVVALSPVLQSSNFNRESGHPSWWLTVTQERGELFAPINRALWVIGGLSVGLVGALILLGAAAGRRLVRPILALQQGAEELGRGNLDYRLRIQTRDE